MTDTDRPNAQLAYCVLDHIAAHPEQWRQREWISRPKGNECGTAGCMAGWACLLSGDQPHWGWKRLTSHKVVDSSDHDVHYVMERAQFLLGIGEDDAYELFHEDNTYDDLVRYVEKLFGPRPAEAVADVQP